MSADVSESFSFLPPARLLGLNFAVKTTAKIKNGHNITAPMENYQQQMNPMVIEMTSDKITCAITAAVSVAAPSSDSVSLASTTVINPA